MGGIGADFEVTGEKFDEMSFRAESWALLPTPWTPGRTGPQTLHLSRHAPSVGGDVRTDGAACLQTKLTAHRCAH